MSASAPPLSAASSPDPRAPGFAQGLGSRRWFTLALFLVVAGAVYLPTVLRAEFLNFDDGLFFGPENPEFAAGNVAHILDPRRTIANAYLPVSHLSLYLDYEVFGGGATGPHLVSLLLHVLAAFALVRWLLAMGLRALPAHVAGALFLLHPALAESVAWVSSRKDVLSGLFAFLALGFTARYARQPSGVRLVGLTGCGVLAMYSKATAIVLPGLALLTCWFLAGTSRRRWGAVAALTAVAVPIGWHHRLLAQQEGTLVIGDLWARTLQVPGALGHYLRTAFWPGDLNVLYPEVQTMDTFRQLLLPAALVVGAVVLVAAVAARTRRGRLLALGIGLGLMALLPFNTAFPASNVAAADRYLYLAVPGLALALVSLGRVGVWAGLVACVPLMVVTANRAGAFESSTRLWEASLSVSPENPVAQMNLAFELRRLDPNAVARPRRLFERAAKDARYPIHVLRAEENLAGLAMLEGRYEVAAHHALEAVRAADALPESEAGRERRLQTLLSAFRPLQLAGRQGEARAMLVRSQQLGPDHPTVRSVAAMVALAEVVEAAGDGPVAADHPSWARCKPDLEAVLAEDPGHYEANLVMGRWQQALGRNIRAIAHFRRAIAARPDVAESYHAAAAVWQNQRLFEDAEVYARSGLAACPEDPALRLALALALAGQQRWDDAIRHLEGYVSNRPRDRQAARILAHLLVSKAVAGMSQTPLDQLEELAERARRHNPDEPKIDIVLGRVARDRRQWLVALHHLERAREAFPADVDVLRMLAMTYFDRGWELKLGGNPQAAFDQWRRFLDLAPPDVPTETVASFLVNEWKRLEAQGIEHLRQGISADAERCFRRCLELLPERHWGAWLLARVLFEREGADLLEVDQLLATAIDGQERHGLDASRQVLLRIWTLQKLGRDEAATALGREFVAAPGAAADPAVVERIRSVVGG